MSNKKREPKPLKTTREQHLAKLSNMLQGWSVETGLNACTVVFMTDAAGKVHAEYIGTERACKLVQSAIEVKFAKRSEPKPKGTGILNVSGHEIKKKVN